MTTADAVKKVGRIAVNFILATLVEKIERLLLRTKGRSYRQGMSLQFPGGDSQFSNWIFAMSQIKKIARATMRAE